MKNTSYNRQLNNGVWVEIEKRESTTSKTYHIKATWGTPIAISYQNTPNQFSSITDATRHIEDEIVLNDLTNLVKQSAAERGLSMDSGDEFLYVAGLAFDVHDLIFLPSENEFLKQVYNIAHAKTVAVKVILDILAKRF